MVQPTPRWQRCLPGTAAPCTATMQHAESVIQPNIVGNVLSLIGVVVCSSVVFSFYPLVSKKNRTFFWHAHVFITVLLPFRFILAYACVCVCVMRSTGRKEAATQGLTGRNGVFRGSRCKPAHDRKRRTASGAAPSERMI